MAENWVLNKSFMSLYLMFLIHVSLCHSQEQAFNTYTISSFSYARTVLIQYQWQYIRVELPPWFSSMSLALESDVDLDLNRIKDASGSSLKIICCREGSPPLPDVYNISLTDLGYISNDSFVGTQSPQIEKCFPMQKNIRLRVTNEQTSPGTWYFGLFNGIGPVRTQSKMINRGSSYSFSANISVEGCTNPVMSGSFCNQTVNMLTCNDIRTEENVMACRNANGIVCREYDGPQFYSLDVIDIVEQLLIVAANVTYEPSIITGSRALMCYVRHGALPLKAVYDFSGDISKAPLVIHFPRAGRWYITVQPINASNKTDMENDTTKVCYLLEGQVLHCPVNKAGLNCTSERYQTVIKKNPSAPSESNYVPISGNISSASADFALEPLLSNFSGGEISNDSWTFFLLEVPSGGATGGNIHIHLSSDTKINYEIYARYGGLPSLSSQDYFYANRTSSSNGSMFFKIYDSSENKISFYIFYVKGGTWTFGLRQLTPASSASQTILSLSLESCPQKCSSHGKCVRDLEISGLTFSSYCDCDRTHGGFDCSIELVSHTGHIRQSIFLIASNAAALLPAYWALRNKAFAEWVLFTASGISSALYHACDVGATCALNFNVLQFLDFWLSFMAVVSTFVYLTTISEASKRTIHTVVAILTALMAANRPTSSKNISFVIGMGALALLVGWLIEFSTHYRLSSISRELHFNLLERWETIKGWIRNIIKTVVRRFQWGFILAGFTALAMAAISWKMESTESYWIWHSLWHVSIYTSSFLFLCSKAKIAVCEDGRPSGGTYELTRQASFGGGEQGLER